MAWLQAGVFVLLIGALLSQPALVLLAGLLVAALVIAWAWSRVSFRGVGYDRHVSPDRAIAGDAVTLRITVTNAKIVPVASIILRDRLPAALEPVDAPVSPGTDPTMVDVEHATALGWYERVTWTYDLRCPRRGAYTLGPVDAESSDAFGLFPHTRRFDVRTSLLVLPAVKPLEAFGLPPQLPLGPTPATHRRFDDPLQTDGVRDYRAGDSVRRVHWPATAHIGRLQIRTPAPSTDWRVMILLNAQTLARPWQGVDAEALERCVDVAAAVALQAIRSGIPTGIAANVSAPGERRLLRVAPGLGDGQGRAVLEALAAVGPFEAARFEAIVADEAQRITFGATLVLVTSVVEPELRAVLSAESRAHVQFVLVVCSVEPPEPMPGVTAFHVPSIANDMPISPSPVGASAP